MQKCSECFPSMIKNSCDGILKNMDLYWHLVEDAKNCRVPVYWRQTNHSITDVIIHAVGLNAFNAAHIKPLCCVEYIFCHSQIKKSEIKIMISYTVISPVVMFGWS